LEKLSRNEIPDKPLAGALVNPQNTQELFKSIFGYTYRVATGEFNDENASATRVSIALIASRMMRDSLNAGEGNPGAVATIETGFLTRSKFITDVKELWQWLSNDEIWGEADYTIKGPPIWSHRIHGKKGIFIIIGNKGNHATLWTGNNVIGGHNYIDRDCTIYFWELKGSLGSRFCDPLETMQIRRNRASNLFGKVRTNNSKNHQGFDYYALSGTEVKAVSDGKVEMIVNPSAGDYGIQIAIKLDNSPYYAFYAHLSEIATGIVIDSKIKKGDVIGKTGISGNAINLKGNDQHLHFECRTILSPGIGLGGRITPNSIVATKFYSQSNTIGADGNYIVAQTNIGVKRVSADGTETLMEII
jgi:hypothetical protein